MKARREERALLPEVQKVGGRIETERLERTGLQQGRSMMGAAGDTSELEPGRNLGLGHRSQRLVEDGRNVGGGPG